MIEKILFKKWFPLYSEVSKWQLDIYGSASLSYTSVFLTTQEHGGMFHSISELNLLGYETRLV